MSDTEIPTVTSTTTPAPAPAAEKGPDGNAYDLILKVAGAVGTGIGVLGFVTFFGGAILWLRSNEAELPATDAIAAVPSSVLVTAGAEWLVPAVLLAVLTVGILALIHQGFNGWRHLKLGDELDAGEQLLEEAAELQVDAEKIEREAGESRAYAITLAGTAEAAASAKDEAGRKFNADRAALETSNADAKKEVAGAKFDAAAHKKDEGEGKIATAKAGYAKWQRATEYAVAGLLLLVLPTVFYPTLFHLSIAFHTFVLIVVALAVAVISLVVYRATERFVWFGVTAFLMIGIYVGFVTYYATTNNPKAEPAAVLRTGHPPVAGMYIAETSSNLYLGTFPEQDQRPRLMVIPKAQVTDLAIGPLVDPDEARRRAIGLTRQLCAMKITVPKAPATAAGGAATEGAADTAAEPATTESETKTACSAEEIAAVEAALKG